MRTTASIVAIAALALSCVTVAPANAEVLITKAEADLPAASGTSGSTRGLTRGPGIELVSPNPIQSVTSPMPLKIKFQPRNNVAIDPASVKVIYVKAKPIDLTDRIKRFVTPSGIDMAQAEVPPGTHMMRVDVTDQQGRSSSSVFKVTVANR
jgi:hypothetical protein